MLLYSKNFWRYDCDPDSPRTCFSTVLFWMLLPVLDWVLSYKALLLIQNCQSMKTLRLELMIYAVGSWVVRYTLALREFLTLDKPMFAAGRLPFFCLLSLEIIDTCFPPRACPGHYKYLSILCRVSFIAFSVFYVKGKNGTSFIVELESSSQGFYIFLFFLVIIHS